jgi:hypothetical protein
MKPKKIHAYELANGVPNYKELTVCGIGINMFKFPHTTSLNEVTCKLCLVKINKHFLETT